MRSLKILGYISFQVTQIRAGTTHIYAVLEIVASKQRAFVLGEDTQHERHRNFEMCPSDLYKIKH
jgi:hypothetical protein